MDERLKAFRRMRPRGRGGRRRYPAEARKLAIAYAKARGREGAKPHRAARELGIPMQTLQGWSRPDATFRRVTIEPAAAAPPRLIVRTLSGLIIEGLDVAGIAELSRALAPR
jgi:hypothetical protein